MGWLVLGVHISSNWWGCPSACPAPAVADRNCVPWAVVASTSCRVLCQVAKWFWVRLVQGRVTLALWRLVHTRLVPAAGGEPGSRVVGPVVVAACAFTKTGCMPQVLPHQSAVGVRFLWLSWACDFTGPTCWATLGAVGRGRGVCPLAGGPASGSG